MEGKQGRNRNREWGGVKLGVGVGWGREGEGKLFISENPDLEIGIGY